MKAKLISQGAFIEVGDDMTWPNPTSNKIKLAEWRMRHTKYRVTESDMTVAASVMEAYRDLIMHKTIRDRNKLCSAIKNAVE